MLDAGPGDTSRDGQGRNGSANPATDAAARIRVFVVDDHPLARSGLASMLAQSEGLIWVVEAATAADALRAAPMPAPDGVLMDDDLTNMDGVQALQQLRPLLPRTRFVLLTRAADPGLQQRGLEAGVVHLLPRTAPPRWW